MVQGASSARPWLPSVSPMETASPSRQDRQPRLLLALRAKTAHFCRRGEKRQRGEPVHAPGDGCILLGAGRGAAGAYEGGGGEAAGQHEGSYSAGDGLRGSVGGSAMHGTHHAPGTLVPFPC